MAKVSQVWADRDDELRETEGPEQEGFEPATSYIVIAAEACSLALFLGMVAVWVAVGDRFFPEVLQ